MKVLVDESLLFFELGEGGGTILLREGYFSMQLCGSWRDVWVVVTFLKAEESILSASWVRARSGCVLSLKLRTGCGEGYLFVGWLVD